MQFAFDKAGGGYLWAAGSIVFATKKKLILKADNDIMVSTKKNFAISAGDTGRIDGGGLLELVGKVVKIGPGTNKVAFEGCPVAVQIPPGTLVAITPAGPVPVVATLNPALPATVGGNIATGRANVLV
jgi:hypothetical protein